MWFIVTDEATKYHVKIGPPPLAVVRSAALGALQALHGEPPRAATCSYPAPRSERSRRFNLSETGSRLRRKLFELVGELAGFLKNGLAISLV
jgi:hypothetical protein